MGESELYCHNCGAKSISDSTFCIECGARLLTLEEEAAIKELANTEVAAGHEVATELSNRDIIPVKEPIRGRGRMFLWIIPLLLVMVTLSLFLFYKYEIKVNDQVLALQQKAEGEAMKGRYSEAIKLLDSAIEKRPGYDVLKQDRSVTVEAQQFEEQLKQTIEGLDTQKLQASESSMKTLTAALDKRQEPLFASIKKKLSEGQTKLAILKVKGELGQLKTVEALADKLKIVEKFEGEEAVAVQQQIIVKLADISYSAAEKKLQDKDYTGALQAVDDGLFYAIENKKLTTFRERIMEEKTIFEQAEKDRIVLAQQQAAQEDLTNRTAAVEVSGLVAVYDEYGYLEISGTVTNRATRPIYSINLTINILDAADSYLDEAYVSVYPNRLAPGESGEFTTSYYGAYGDVKVAAADANWYLE
ncbi:FxLYD domain-containing protein [Paenibacillus wynnii]|uniref:FxLYD domain-containing protein n=1 Tax=Paenibacillus wynnii TaxID=268407 RepID=UPI0027906672|nr:FxLYD domain-containing protein [Paenibacillus wynnii]MDQ0194135.1 tetratricopeptide (TPR) repeat protein [Paenibacillus wynnii]